LYCREKEEEEEGRVEEGWERWEGRGLIYELEIQSLLRVVVVF